jgi:WD40 repeat protein
VTLPGDNRDEDKMEAVAFSPNGNLLATSRGERVILWEPRSGHELIALEGHERRVYSVAFDPGGRRLASAGRDGTVRLWDTGHVRATAILRGHSGPVLGVAFAPDGTRVASAGADKTARIWDIATGGERITLRGHSDQVYAVAFSPGGRWIATASKDHTVRLWDAATGEPARTLSRDAQTDEPFGNAIAFSPDGRRIATTNSDFTIRLYEVETGREALALRGHSGQLNGLAFFPDGSRIATASDDRTVRLWDTATGDEVFTVRGHTDRISNVAVSPDGLQLVSTSADGSAKIWDATAMTPKLESLREGWGVVDSLFARELSAAEVLAHIRTDPAIRDEVRQSALALAESLGPTLALRAAVSRVQALFNKPLLREDVLETLRHDAGLSEPLRKELIALAEQHPEDGNRLNNASWAEASHPGREPSAYLRAVRLAEGACRLDPNNGLSLNTLGVARYRAGRYQDAVADLSRSLKLNAARFGGPTPSDLAFLSMALHKLGQPVEARKTLEQLRDVMSRKPWSDDSESINFSEEANSMIAGTELPKLEIAQFVDDATGAAEIAVFSPDGRRVLSGHEDGTMRLWDRESGRVIRRFGGHVGRLLSVAFSPDGRRALSGGSDKLVRLWEIESGKLVREFQGHAEWVFSVAFSRDGGLAYSTSGGPDLWHDGLDSGVRVWDVEAGGEVRRMEGHKGRVIGLAVSPDGRRVLTGGNTSLILWDADSGQEIRRLLGHTDAVDTVAFLPDGRRAVSAGGGDRTIRLWDLETGKELHRFLGHPREVIWVAVSPDGRRLLSSDYNGRELRLWDVEGRKLIRRIGWGGTSPTRGAFSSDGRHAVWGGADGVVRLYRLPEPDGANPPAAPAQPARPDPGRRPETKK